MNILIGLQYFEFSDPTTVVVGSAVDCGSMSASPAVFLSCGPGLGDPGVFGEVACDIEESDDGLTGWSAMAGVSLASAVSDNNHLAESTGVRSKRYVRATLTFTVADTLTNDQPVGVIIGDVAEIAAADDPIYFGRFQQGTEIAIVLQCTNIAGTPDDPDDLPSVQIYRDAATPVLVTSKQMPAEARRVEDGIFRLSLFLDTLYSTEGRYLVLMKWLDSVGVAHVRTGSFHLLPGGSPDGAVISMYSLIRQDATYLLMQHDSGRITRKRNPR